MDKKKSILAVFPHPDDESFGRAGTLIKHADNGDDITLICATMGQMGRRMGNPFFANRETLPDVREKELKDACDKIGINRMILWKMQDKTLQFRDPEFLANRILKVIEDVKPEIIYTFYPEHGVHPDHDALSKATAIAVSELSVEERPLIYGAAITREREEELGRPDMVVDVSDVLDQKMDVMRAHRSQSELITLPLDMRIREAPELKEQILEPFSKESYWVYPIS
ncbi:putative N-acetyl-alpha-D-glucosaminyl L-malate deacetylase [Lentibacillus sp. JNUCC-1]|uniref:bacillithiol biosynthesis deacetylase BshB2 n=1 Tax=Lentibacillus sp. JNUCC-1 TaxID=2654513 RepID=UPI0012E96FE8|nr:bacillithiol biosynthesis deacetylase BshB2 [Lentibacillus sp. JNUCC-1]MUV37045.1 putative N-acetyl-alpha-D-glucosaminyl L-malate deacetylase [Lentibacillus sp. JNUCC-1]